MESELELPDYCSELLKKVEEKTGYPLRIIEKEILEFDSVLKVATSKRPYHQLTYLTAYSKHRNHFIVNNSFKILRLWKVPAEERLMPATEIGRRLPDNEHRELAKKLSLGAEDEFVQKMSCFIYGGLARQLTSFPVDLQVEKEVSQSFPEHSGKQLSYLQNQVKDFLPTLDEQMLSTIPERIYRASTAMNIAFAETAAELAGVRPGSVFRHHSSRKLAERLLEDLKEVKEPGYRGDIKLTDAWARELGLVGWYEWVRWEKV